jgi:hypothetical protein
MAEPAGFLLNAITHAEKAWAQYPEFKPILFKLNQIRNELSVLNASAGQRAAASVAADAATPLPPARGEAL